MGTVTVTIDSLLSGWLPLPQATLRVLETSDPGSFNAEQWRWTSMANTAKADGHITRRDDQYAVVFGASLPAASQPTRYGGSGRITDPANAPESLAPYLALPDDLPVSISDAATQVAGDATDRLAVARALEAWFRGGEFAYDESAPYQPGADPNDPFQVMEALLEERRGFCVHYAATAAVMARHLGVPARVNVGYAVQAQEVGTTVVRGRDLHAWPEVYIDGTGWVAFEPTPGGAGMRADTAEDVPAVSEEPEVEASPEPTETPEAEDPADTDDPAADDSDASDSDSRDGEGAGLSPLAITLLIVLLGLTLLGLPAVLRRARGARRARSIRQDERAAENAWAELHDTVVDLGYLARPEDLPRARTPEALVEYLAERQVLDDAGASAAGRIAEAATVERYAGTASPEAFTCCAGRRPQGCTRYPQRICPESSAPASRRVPTIDVRAHSVQFARTSPSTGTRLRSCVT